MLPKITISIATTDSYHPSPDNVSSYPIYESNNYLPTYDCWIDFRIGSKWLGIFNYTSSNYKAVLVIGYSGLLYHAWKSTSGWSLSRVYTP